MEARLKLKLELSQETNCLPYLACFMVSSNMQNSLSLSECREQNIDSWKPGLDVSLLTKHIRVDGLMSYNCVRALAKCSQPPGLTSLKARSPSVCSSRRPGSGALSAQLPTPRLHFPDPSCRWRGCCSSQSSAGPVSAMVHKSMVDTLHGSSFTL